MTPEEERIYLTNLLIDATAWQISEGETRSGIELECIDRLRKLNNMPTIDVVGKPSDEVLNDDDYKALEAARLNEHLANRNKSKNAKERWKHGRVRVTIDGKPVWKLERDCHKEIIPGFEKKWHWVWNGSDDKKDQEQVNKLSDELWNEHEKGE